MAALVEAKAELIDSAQLEALRDFTEGLTEGALRDLLASLSDSLSSGFDLALLDQSTEFTPAQAAARLKMSRTHLYKLLDADMIPFHHVGRDRRICGPDLVAFERRRQTERRELAERLARPTAIASAADDELADIL